MAEDHESDPGHQDPKAENHIRSDRKSGQNFFEGRHIDHDWPTGSTGSADNRNRLQKILDGLRGRTTILHTPVAAHHEIKDQKKYWKDQDGTESPEEKTDKA